MAMFYEMIGRLFSRAQMRNLGGLLESAGVDFVADAVPGFGACVWKVMFVGVEPSIAICWVNSGTAVGDQTCAPAAPESHRQPAFHRRRRCGWWYAASPV